MLALLVGTYREAGLAVGLGLPDPLSISCLRSPTMFSIALVATWSTLDWLKLLWATGRSDVAREKKARTKPVNSTTKASTMMSAAARSREKTALRTESIYKVFKSK